MKQASALRASSPINPEQHVIASIFNTYNKNSQLACVIP
jgi:hypothetical protein